MTEKTLRNHIKKCGELKTQIDALTALFNDEKKNITDALNERKTTDFTACGYLVKLATFTSSRFDSKALKTDDPKLYAAYTRNTEQTRFTVTAI